MTTIYIKESNSDEDLIINNKIPKFLKKIVIKIKKKVNIITQKQIDDKKIYIIPDINNKNFIKRLQNKLQKEQESIQLVLSNKIKKLNLEFGKIKIVDGKKIQKYAIEEILKYIVNLYGNKNEKLEFQDIYIMQKEHSFETMAMIEYLKDKVKTVNIITNAIEKYKKLEDSLYNNGYLITVSNNKKKSLKKAKIIINMDFSKDEISNYVIDRNSIIINFTNNKIDNLKCFDGIIINTIKIYIKEEIEQSLKDMGIYNEFEKIELYESICKIENFEKQVQKMKEEIRIIELIGNNGKISEKEPLFNKNILDKYKKVD